MKSNLVSKILVGESSSPTKRTLIPFNDNEQWKTSNNNNKLQSPSTHAATSSPFSSRSSSSMTISDSVDDSLNNHNTLNSSLSEDDILETVEKSEEQNYVFEINDYSKLTPWEKFVDQMESCIVTWCTNTQHVKHSPGHGRHHSDFSHHSQLLVYGGTKYRLTYYNFKNNNNKNTTLNHSQTLESPLQHSGGYSDTNFLLEHPNDFPHRSHHLTRWFGVQEFLILSLYIEKRNDHSPQKPLSKQVITTLLSAISIALSNTHLNIPYFVLCDGVHDYIGRFDSCSQITRFKSESLRKQLEQNKYLSSRYTKLSGIIELFCFNIGKHVKICNEIQIKARYNYILESFNSQQWNYVKNDFSMKESRIGSLDIPLGCKYDPIHSITMACLFPNVHHHSHHDIDELDITSSSSWEVRMNVAKRPELEHTDGLHRLLFDIYLPFKSENNNYINTSTQDNTNYIHEAIIDIFDVHNDFSSGSQFMKQCQLTPKSEISSYIPKSCHPSSLLRRFCDHLPKMKNMTDISILWKNFIRILFKFWEEANIQDISVLAQITPDQTFIPFTKDDVSWSQCCLLEQKIDMLNVCCKRECEKAREKFQRKELKRKHLKEEWKDSGLDISSSDEEDDEYFDVQSEDDMMMNVNTTTNTTTMTNTTTTSIHSSEMASHHPLIQQTLEMNGRKINIPITQHIPTKTEDVIEEEQQLLSNMESSQQRARYQCESLLSDMQAFKYVNPSADFSDFLLWYSPKDVIDSSSSSLSSRMSSQSNENIWKQFWDEAQPKPISKQKSLFDHKLHAEKVIHYLDTVEMTNVMDELMICSLVATYYSLREWWMDIVQGQTNSIRSENENTQLITMETHSILESTTPVITKIEERFAFIREVLKKLSKESILQQTDLLEVLTEKLQELEKSISIVISVLSKFDHDKRWLEHPLLQCMELLIFNENFSLTTSKDENTTIHQLLCKKCTEKEDNNSEEDNHESQLNTELLVSKRAVMIHATEHAREFILRCNALRPYLNSDATPQLLYALISRDEIRVSTALTEKVPW